MNREIVMPFICFSLFETNGNFLISSIFDELLILNNQNDTRFMKDFEEHGLYAALIFADACMNESTRNGLAYGSSLM